MGQQYLTITALTKYLKRKFEADPYLERVYLTGEISNFRIRMNSHQYFSLKDNQAKISAIMFRNAFQKLKFKPEEGMKVLVIGRISLYEPSGSYQIYIEHMEPDGIGALYQALEEMKKKLAAEGIFSAPKKRLPHYPKRIAVITSPSGAVIRDIVTTVERRYPIAQLVLFPTLVQGAKAGADIVRNIQRADEADKPFDVLIVARGGGSIEDLWPFNEEKVVRAIAASRIPVISSVGHETDTTLADLVADVRAATPTAAAELAVPVLTEELLKIKERENRLIQAFSTQLQRRKDHFNRLQQSYIFHQPQRLYEGFSLRLDLLQQRMNQAMQLLDQEKEQSFKSLYQRLIQTNPQARLPLLQQRVLFAQQQLIQSVDYTFEQKQKRFQRTIQALELLSPLKIMSRGYSYVTEENQQVVRSASQLEPGKRVILHMHDGESQALIENVTTLKEVEDTDE